MSRIKKKLLLVLYGHSTREKSWRERVEDSLKLGKTTFQFQNQVLKKLKDCLRVVVLSLIELKFGGVNYAKAKKDTKNWEV